jgi:Tol biopolymer transport system component
VRGPVATIASSNGIELTGGFSDSFIAQASQSWPSDWSTDGRYIVGEALHANTLVDLWAADVRDNSSPQIRELSREPGNQRDPRISPDGRWLAYASDEGTGTYEVYVRAVPGRFRHLASLERRRPRPGLDTRWS